MGPGSLIPLAPEEVVSTTSLPPPNPVAVAVVVARTSGGTQGPRNLLALTSGRGAPRCQGVPGPGSIFPAIVTAAARAAVAV